MSTYIPSENGVHIVRLGLCFGLILCGGTLVVTLHPYPFTPATPPPLKSFPSISLENRAYVLLLPRVFWFGPMLGGVLATLVWEGILRPAQPVQPPVQPERKNILEAHTVRLSGSMSSATREA